MFKFAFVGGAFAGYAKGKRIARCGKIKICSVLYIIISSCHNTAFLLSMNPPKFHLMVDWSTKGVGYALFAGHLRQAILVGINSKEFQEDVSSSFLGELKGLVWALNNVKGLVQSRLMVLSTNSRSMFKRLTGIHTEPKKMKDKRVSRLLAWLWGTFSSTQLNVRFVPGLENIIADVMSRWGSKSGNPKEGVTEMGVDDITTIS